MAEVEDRRVALLSIHPLYARALMSGEKTVEFRRRALSSETAFVIVYATAPVRMVVGWFEVDGIASDTPASLWARFGKDGHVDRQAFERYYAQCDTGSAIQVRTAVALDQPIALSELSEGMTAPQSYRYVSTDVMASLSERVGAS